MGWDFWTLLFSWEKSEKKGIVVAVAVAGLGFRARGRGFLFLLSGVGATFYLGLRARAFGVVGAGSEARGYSVIERARLASQMPKGI